MDSNCYYGKVYTLMHLISQQYPPYFTNTNLPLNINGLFFFINRTFTVHPHSGCRSSRDDSYEEQNYYTNHIIQSIQQGSCAPRLVEVKGERGGLKERCGWAADPGPVKYQPDRLLLRSELLWELVVLKSCDWLCGILLDNPSANR